MSYINIKTTQNVDITYEAANLSDRILAFFVDLLIILLINILFAILTSVVFSVKGEKLGFLISFGAGLVAMFYSLISETIGKGASIGKRALKIKVIKLDGKEPNIGDYFIRWIFRFIDIVISFGTLAIFSILSGKNNQRIGDLIANTTIIKTSFNKRLNVNALENIRKDAEVTFPESRYLNEEYVLIIKNVLDRYKNYPNEANSLLLKETQDKLLENIDFNITERITTHKFLQTVLRDYVILSR